MRTGGTRYALVVVVVGSLLAVAGPALWLLQRDTDPEEFGADVAQALAAPSTPSTQATPTTTATTATTADPAVPSAPADPVPPVAPTSGTAPPVSTSSARLVDVVRRSDPPVEVRIRAAVAPVDAVGLDDRQLVVVPEDVRRAGWYSPGPEPGAQQGSAVLVGHVDDREQGLGAFAALRESAPGDEVTVTTASGERLRYEVVALEQFDKDRVPLDRLFDPTGDPRLVLMSCGGTFDPTTRSYSDNVVITAVPRPRA